MKRKKPAYLTLYEKIKKEIVEGVYVNGNRLPSKRVLAQNLGISIITIEHAYELLGEENICPNINIALERAKSIVEK